MDTEPVHTNVVEDEEVDDEDEDLSDDYTGTEEDESSDDDFEFKDLEKEIYGRLGGPPPELKEAMEKVVVIDQKEKKSSKNKDVHQSIKEEANNIKSSTLRETPILPVDGEKAMTDKPEKQTKEAVAPPKGISTESIPAMETDVISTTDISNVSPNHENNQSIPKNIDKVECAKTKDDEEARMDDCGCIVM